MDIPRRTAVALYFALLSGDGSCGRAIATPSSPIAPKVTIEELNINWGTLEDFFSVEGPGVENLRGSTFVTFGAVSTVGGPTPEFKAKFYDADGAEVSGSRLGLESPFNLMFFLEDNPSEAIPASWTPGQRSKGMFSLPRHLEDLARVKPIRISSLN